MRSIILGFWMAWIGWGWMTYPTGKVEEMDAAGALFFVIGSLVVLYHLLFNHLIPMGGVRWGFSLFYIAWGWDWMFWRLAPAGDYLDMSIGSVSLSMEVVLILVGCVAIIYSIYRYMTNPLTSDVLPNFYPTLVAAVKNLTWEQVQQGVGKLLGISIEVIFLLFGFSYMSGYLDATPSPEAEFTLTVFFIIVTVVVLMALGHFASFAEEKRGLPTGMAGAYLLIFGLVFLVSFIVATIQGTLSVITGELITILMVAGGILMWQNKYGTRLKIFYIGPRGGAIRLILAIIAQVAIPLFLLMLGLFESSLQEFFPKAYEMFFDISEAEGLSVMALFSILALSIFVLILIIVQIISFIDTDYWRSLKIPQRELQIIGAICFIVGLIVFILQVEVVIQALREISEAMTENTEFFILGILLVAAGILILLNAKDLNMKNYLPGKGILAGIGCLIAGIFDFYYVIYKPTDFVVTTIVTPSIGGGLFMGYSILEGIALILVFVALVILPRMDVPRNTRRLMFVLPLVLYGISLILIPIVTVEFTAEQPYSVFWTRGVQMSVVAGILALIYSASRVLPQYRKSPRIFGDRA